MTNSKKHRNYDVMNLIGYGLAKFDMQFVRLYGFDTKSALYRYFVDIGITDKDGSVKGFQDNLDCVMPESFRQGYHNSDKTIRRDYQARKDYIDSFAGKFSAEELVDFIKLAVAKRYKEQLDKRDLLKGRSINTIKPLKQNEQTIKAKPIIRSFFKQLQLTGNAAESYFLAYYHTIVPFADADIEDARLFGDGYDFQLTLPKQIYLAEVKGLQTKAGTIRMTQNEYEKAQEYNSDYALVIVANLQDIPEFLPIFNPLAELTFEKRMIPLKEQTFYQTGI